MAVGLLAFSSSYCFSETVRGTTNNAAANSLQWDMSNVLPPQAGLTIDGLTYRYTVEKQTEDGLKVTVQNENPINGGYIFSETDDWSGLPSNTILKNFQLNDIPKEYFGTGSIVTEGFGSVVDPTVRYTYTYDVCYDPLSSPECPGWAAALYEYLLNNNLLKEDTELEDPYQNEFLQQLLKTREELAKKKSEESEEDLVEEKEEEAEKELLEKVLSISNDAIMLVDAMQQQQILNALVRPDVYALYKQREIQGGEYLETVKLQDKKINDNRGAALRMGLAQDKVHEDMVSSQYKLMEN